MVKTDKRIPNEEASAFTSATAARWAIAAELALEIGTPEPLPRAKFAFGSAEPPHCPAHGPISLNQFSLR